MECLLSLLPYVEAGSKHCGPSDLIVGGVHICKLVGELNHLLLTDVSSQSLVILLRISGGCVGVVGKALAIEI